MPKVRIIFSSPATAEYRVAGVPAAARVAHALAALRSHEVTSCEIDAGSGWLPGEDLRSEWSRLAPSLRLDLASAPDDGSSSLVVRGERLISALASEISIRRELVLPALFDASVRGEATMPDPARESDDLALLRRAGARILAATGKPGDGIVSRYLNRPISRAISRLLLMVPGIVPSHASLGTAIIGAAMALALLLGDEAGLLLGAVLFQAASIFDGVDGEMARATFRTSEHGATLDSVIDAGTNLAFVTGVAVNVGLAGDVSGAAAGIAALAMLATGLLLIGRRAEASGQPVNFDVVKVYFRSRRSPSRVMEWLILFTMRDFFAAACAVLIVAGLSHGTLLAFATVSAGWLMVTLAVLAREARPVHSSLCAMGMMDGSRSASGRSA